MTGHIQSCSAAYAHIHQRVHDIISQLECFCTDLHGRWDDVARALSPAVCSETRIWTVCRYDTSLSIFKLGFTDCAYLI